MGVITFGRGIGNGLSCFGPDDTGPEGKSIREREEERVAHLTSKMKQPIKWMIANDELEKSEEEYFEELWAIEDPEEQEAYVTSLRRKVGSKKAQITRERNKARKERKEARLAEIKGTETALEGERFLYLKWVRKDWKRRIKAIPGATDHILEITVVDASIPIAMVRVKVFEESEVSKEIEVDTGKGTLIRKQIAKPDWRMDAHQRKFHVAKSTWEMCRKVVGDATGLPHAILPQKALEMRKMADKKNTVIFKDLTWF